MARVKMGDRITKQRAEELAKNLLAGDEKEFIATLPGVYLTQGEFDIYIRFRWAIRNRRVEEVLHAQIPPRR